MDFLKKPKKENKVRRLHKIRCPAQPPKTRRNFTCQFIKTKIPARKKEDNYE